MKFLPINLNIENKRIVIVGGGNVAAHKASILNRFVSNITILAPEIHTDIESSAFSIIRKRYEKGDLAGFDLVYICTDNRELNRQIKRDAQELHLMSSVCDAPDECDFVSPAICQVGHFTIAVGSDGREVKKSVALRNQIQKLIDNGTIIIE